MRISLAILASLLLCFSAAAKKEKITITGSSTVAPLALELAKAFEKDFPKTRLEVQTGGSTRGIIEARKGIADIGMVSRDLKKAEADLTAFPIALDGLAVIVNKKNPVTNLTKQQVVDIYKGKIKSWRELGGSSQQIVLVHKSEGRSTLEVFLKYFGLKNTQINPHVIIGDNEQGVKTVAGNPAAVAYVSIGTAEHDAGLGVPIKLLDLDGVAATTANLREGRFPISRTLNFVVKKAPRGAKKDFLKFAQSENAHKIIEDLSLIPIQR